MVGSLGWRPFRMVTQQCILRPAKRYRQDELLRARLQCAELLMQPMDLMSLRGRTESMYCGPNFAINLLWS